MSKSTPGPWKVDPPSQTLTGVGILTADGEEVAEVFEPMDGSWARQESNARLISASPELLASLIEFVDCLDGEHTIEMYHRARAAIAKAEGRNPPPCP